MAGLSLRGITQRYPDGSEVLRTVDLEVADGEFVVLVGPSGCGKSTLLRVVAGLVQPTAGDVRLDGRRVNDLEPGERDVAMVFQNYALYPHMTVRKNLAFPLVLARRPKAEVAARVGEVAELLGLVPLLDRKPSQLSGGQMQRVAVGRALVRRPAVFLFDEPLSNLDAKLRGDMRRELAELHRRLGVTTLYVTHDQAEAMTLGSRICVMEGGRLLQSGPPLEVFERPAERFVAGFIGSPAMNLLEGPVRGGRFTLGPLSVPCPVRAEGRAVLGVRPEDVREEPQGELELVVDSVEALGSMTHFACPLGQVGPGPELRAVRSGHRAPPRAGDRVRLRLPAERLHWFDPQSGARLGGPVGAVSS